MTAGPRLATRMMLAQVMVICVGAITLLVTAFLVAPGLFHEHLTHIGVDSPAAQHHAEEAFASAFAISVAVAAGTALLAAILLSWLVVRRISRPVEQLAEAAESVAAGRYDVSVPRADFSRELGQLSESFARMAGRLGETESSRSRLLSDLAHELRTPLATLEAYVDGLEDHVLPDEPSSWSTMRDQVERLRRLSTDLRDAAAAEEHALNLELEPLDARELSAAAVAAALPRYAARGVDLRAYDRGEGCPVLGDRVRLQQVLANLLDNALRHTPAGGSVDVDTERRGGTILVTVTDTGEGIEPAQLEAVFERFHRVDPSRVATDGSGSGLGLTIARAIVRDHGGTLVARSAGLGRGAAFTIALPESDQRT
jgi:two-component system, OmpR family, sensor histidine kinase BaeS